MRLLVYDYDSWRSCLNATLSLQTSFSVTGSLRVSARFIATATTTQTLHTKGETPYGIPWQLESSVEQGAVLQREWARHCGVLS